MTEQTITIGNPAHLDWIEETGNFVMVDRLGIDYCGVCAMYGILTLTDDEAPRYRFHGYAQSTGCPTLTLCPECYEQHPSDGDRESCRLCNV